MSMNQPCEVKLYTEIDNRFHRVILSSNDLDYLSNVALILSMAEGMDYDKRHILLMGVSVNPKGE